MISLATGNNKKALWGERAERNTMGYIEDVTEEKKKAELKLLAIQKLVLENKDLFMDGIDEEILDIIKN